MALSNFSRSILECYGAHYVLHVGCEVPFDNLFVIPALAPDGTGEGVGVMAKSGDFEFVITCGPFEMPREDFAKKWMEAVRVINAASPEEREKVIDATWARQHAVEIVSGYVLKRGRRGI